MASASSGDALIAASLTPVRRACLVIGMFTRANAPRTLLELLAELQLRLLFLHVCAAGVWVHWSWDGLAAYQHPNEDAWVHTRRVYYLIDIASDPGLML